MEKPLTMTLYLGQAGAQALLSVLRAQRGDHVTGFKARATAWDEHASAAADGHDQALGWELQLLKGLADCPMAIV
jgi:hypothetical protein